MPGRSRSHVFGAIVVCLAATHLLIPAAADPPPGSPEWYGREASNWLDSSGRLRDQLSVPEYWALRASQQDPTNADP